MSHFISQYFVGILQLLQNDKINKIIKLKWSTNLNWLKNLKLDGSVKSFFIFLEKLLQRSGSRSNLRNNFSD